MSDRKSIPKTALARIYYIDKEIASGKYPNTTTLSRDYETGTATISRDIEYMRNMLDAPIEYEYTRKGYYYAEQSFRLPGVFASAEDMLALGMAKTLLSLYQNTPIYDTARNLLDSIAAPLDKPGKLGASAGSGNRWYEKRIIAPPIPSISVAPDVWRIICESLRENRVLAFEYRSTWNDGYHTRQVHPYQLLFDNGAWYLYAWSCSRRGTRMFSLSRIKNISLMNKKFTLPKKWDYRAHTDGSFLGVYTDDKKRRFRIRFFNDAAMRIQERRWAAEQRITETPDGVTLEFTSAQYGKVLELVLSQGADALPLEPPELVEDWKRHIRDMGRRARSAKN
jgi:predicted DNA-binding transcriptional regulator YafY